MNEPKTLDYSRTHPVWTVDGGCRSCRQCERRNCVHAGTFYPSCTMHTENTKKETSQC